MARATPVFDDEHLVSLAALAPVMAWPNGRGCRSCLPSGFEVDRRVNPAGEITSIVAGMAAGAGCIDDLDVIRSGGMKQLFGGAQACATLGQLLQELTHGHGLQLASAARSHLAGLVGHTDLLPGI